MLETKENDSLESILALSESIFLLAYMATRCHTLTDTALNDRKTSAAWLSGSILGIMAMFLLLAHKASYHPDEAMDTYITGTDVWLGMQLPIVGAFAGVGLREMLREKPNKLHFRYPSNSEPSVAPLLLDAPPEQQQSTRQHRTNSLDA